MTYTLEGRAAIITGASQGLGLAIARAYVTAGASALPCARTGKTLEQAREGVPVELHIHYRADHADDFTLWHARTPKLFRESGS